ncbi:hypothetical protein IFM89_012243 [Coptis chinensis]|uniref:Uncharacterized protein n=1 Tax=Coptis chinensis TaxID=261450 RepID=A0A835LL45_9MAGN|nr:hypothetical protein IFM89_012243 [Coptis chinensis]
MASHVDVKEIVLVSPSEPTPSHILPLSTLDSQPFLRFTIEYLLVYRSRLVLNRNATAARIKEALSRTLVPYYPLAGRVRARPDGKNLEVVCKAQGALFIEGASENISISEFERAPRCSIQWRNLLTVHVDDVLCGIPPLVVQLTWLANGEAAAIGVGFSHCMADGIGSAEFLNSFADLASGRLRLADFKPKPIWDRHLLNESSQMDPHCISHPEFNRVQDLSGFISRFNQETLSPTSVIFDRKSLIELKKLAHSTSLPSGILFTSFEVLSAHVWRSWARSLNLPSGQILRMLFSINVRNRVKPDIPYGFYGNGFVLGCALTTVKELSDKGLGYAAGLVKKAKERVGDEYVKSVIDLVSESRARPDSVGVLIVSQWSRLGLEKVDFGMGKPVHVGPVCCDRYCLFLPVFEQRDSVQSVSDILTYPYAFHVVMQLTRELLPASPGDLEKTAAVNESVELKNEAKEAYDDIRSEVEELEKKYKELQEEHECGALGGRRDDTLEDASNALDVLRSSTAGVSAKLPQMELWVD